MQVFPYFWAKVAAWSLERPFPRTSSNRYICRRSRVSTEAGIPQEMIHFCAKDTAWDSAKASLNCCCSKCSADLCLTLCSETSLVAELNTVVLPSHSWNNLPGFGCRFLSASKWHRHLLVGLNRGTDNAQCLPSSLVFRYYFQYPCLSLLCVASHIKRHSPLQPHNLHQETPLCDCPLNTGRSTHKLEMNKHTNRVLYVVRKTVLWDFS